MRNLPLALPVLLGLAAFGSTKPALAWGSKGHALGSRAAAESLPREGIDVLARHVDALVYDGDEPDRWRTSAFPELDHAQSPEHFLDLEAWGDPATLPQDRWLFLHALRERPAKDRLDVEPDHVGLVFYKILELEETLEGQLAAGLRHTGPEREAAEELARTTAGLLGHYVLDLANPHHTTIHYNGWRGDNPRGFTTDHGFHHLFESDFVERTVTLAAVTSAVSGIAPRHVADVRVFVLGALRASHAELETLYALEKEGAFARGKEATEAGERGRAFAVARIAAGAADLKDLWVAASERAREGPRHERGRETPRAVASPVPSPSPTPERAREPD